VNGQRDESWGHLHLDSAAEASDESDVDELGLEAVARAEHLQLDSAAEASDDGSDVDKLVLEAVAHAELAAIRQDIRSLAAVVERALRRNSSPPAKDSLQPPGWETSHAPLAQTPVSSEAVAAHQDTGVEEVQISEGTAAELETTKQTIEIDEIGVGLRRDVARIIAAAQHVRESQGIGGI
jgi:hypothetical protein